MVKESQLSGKVSGETRTVAQVRMAAAKILGRGNSSEKVAGVESLGRMASGVVGAARRWCGRDGLWSFLVRRFGETNREFRVWRNRIQDLKADTM